MRAGSADAGDVSRSGCTYPSEPGDCAGVAVVYDRLGPEFGEVCRLSIRLQRLNWHQQRRCGAGGAELLLEGSL